MAREFVPLQGESVEPSQLAVPKARDLATLLEANEIEFSQLVECLSTEGAESVVFDVEVELGQLRAYPIEGRERLAVLFPRSDSDMPEVFALREDFPHVPHVNARPFELPRSLCIYDRPYHELKLRWTSARFVEDIRSWLARTAKGVLHEANQTLEPLLLGSEGNIILPSELRTLASDDIKRLVITATRVEPSVCLLAEFEGSDNLPQNGPRFAVAVLRIPPQQHGLIRRTPKTLDDLATFLAPAGFELRSALRDQFEAWKDAVDEEHWRRLLHSKLVLIISLPKTRSDSGETETTETWAFLSFNSVREAGLDIGIWWEHEGELGHDPAPPPERSGKQISVGPLNPIFRITASQAALLNGLDESNPAKIAAVGVGALGSQVVMSLARSGYGKWSLIDNDDFLPHNAARHELSGFAVGWPKSETVAALANSIVDGEDRFEPLVADVLAPRDHAEALAAAFHNASLIFDMSASLAVSRALSNDFECNARRISIFLNPTGDDLVLIAEDANRNSHLDALEHQYYRALLQDSRLAGHFVPFDDRHRYGQGCRDVTSRIPQEKVALHAAIGSRALRQACSQGEASIAIWRSTENLSVSKIDVPVSNVHRVELSDWTIVIDDVLIARLQSIRNEKLPNETGGVLIGSFDLQRQIVYLVDTLPSPPDSEEWPTLYIRGCHGLRQQVEEIAKKTDSALHYVGEWHSHPDGCSTLPSNDDMQVFAWLTDRMRHDGFPGLMMIAGEKGQLNCFIAEMTSVENLIV